MADPDAILRWLDRLDDLGRDGTVVVLGDDDGAPAKEDLARIADNVTVEDCLVGVAAYLGRDYMPGPSDRHPVTALVRIEAVEPPVLPPGLEPERIVVISEGGEAWSAPLRDQGWDYGKSMAERVARDGPDPRGPSPWDTGTATQVLVRLRDGAGGSHVLRIPFLRINYTS